MAMSWHAIPAPGGIDDKYRVKRLNDTFRKVKKFIKKKIKKGNKPVYLRSKF